MIVKFLRDERGATAIEYALIASLIGLVIIAAVAAVGSSLTGVFEDVAGGFHCGPPPNIQLCFCAAG